MLGKPSEDVEVQFAVSEIVGQLGKVRRGGTAEANLLFPMFTAGCDAREGAVRAEIMERLRGVEGSGMTQVSFFFLLFFLQGHGCPGFWVGRSKGKLEV